MSTIFTRFPETWIPIAGIFLVLTLVVVLLLRGHWRSDWSRRRIRRAFSMMDSLDLREAGELEYDPLMDELGHGLPAWAASYAVERLERPDSPSRRRHLEILSQSDFSPFRERLVDLARSSTDPLAAEIWEVLTGRPRSQWSKALMATDGMAGFSDPPLPKSGRWVGYYVQLGAEHRMDLTLRVEEEAVSGEGCDIVGPYTFSGELLDGEVRLVKRYRGHTVHYAGCLEGDTMVGIWNLLSGSGDFRLWPRRQTLPPRTGSNSAPEGA